MSDLSELCEACPILETGDPDASCRRACIEIALAHLRDTQKRQPVAWSERTSAQLDTLLFAWEKATE